MKYNNKHILEGSNAGEKLVGKLLSYVDDKIKSNSQENIARASDGHSQYKENMISLST